jgi:hypothetical protein
MSSVAATRELILDRYRPLRPLGSGGMGQVWLARDERNGLDVALKIVPREGKAAVRAEREARAAAELRHPRCQRIYAFQRDPGHVYIAYEYVAGRTMRHALHAGEVDDAAAVEIAAQVLDALAHAHARGIVHRDVKPSNVLLADGEELDARLLDFGLAQMAEFDTLTAIGDVPGTLAYVSPERLLGKPGTEAADIWAVGVMLWEALAGHHPFQNGPTTDTARRIQSGAPPLESVRPDLPATLCNAVASALVLAPGRRPAAGSLAHDLRSPSKRRRGRDGSPPSAEAPSFRRHVHLLRDRAVPGVLAGVATGWVASTIPFYPAGWPLGLGLAAGALAAATPRAGLAFALLAAVFPLANISLGLAIVYGVLAAAWLAVSWSDARAGLLAAAGPMLASFGGLGLMPLVAQGARRTVRRAVQAAGGVLLTAVVAGFRHIDFPFGAGAPPLGLGITGSTRPGAVGLALWHALLAHPAVLGEAAVFATAAALLPLARRRGPWPAAIFATAFFAAAAVLAPDAALLPLAASAWIAALALAAEPTN